MTKPRKLGTNAARRRSGYRRVHRNTETRHSVHNLRITRCDETDKASLRPLAGTRGSLNGFGNALPLPQPAGGVNS